jgi:NADPH-dependent 2,4-dienoyl-CoA reductase/sulfur reductase-like enzyme/nitrite reductase/ring-hydroxylating ferredoxin subunit
MSREFMVAKVDDLKDGEMKEVEIAGLKILLTRLAGRFFAIGGECSHFGGPLAEGVLRGEEVTCPWHQARFLVKTGDLVNPPALDAMASFQTRVEGDQVIVEVPEPPIGTRTPVLAKHDAQADGRTFIIVGAGAAGNAAAQKLRQEGYQGRLLLITKELRRPYDRTALSKGYLSGDLGEDALPLRTKEFYESAGIELILGEEVSQVEVTAKNLLFKNGSSLSYDTLLLATGGIARKLTVPGGDLGNVFTLRNPDDADRIIAAADKAYQAVIVGTGFIGMETAAALRKRKLVVVVVGPEAMPLERVLGQEIGNMWLKLHGDHGVRFRLGRKVSRLEGMKQVTGVVLDDGELLAADLVVVGLGVTPALDFLRGVKLNPDGSVTTDKYLRVAEGLYAAGDVARFPDWRTGEPVRIEHWQVAEAHGFTAAQNMLGRQQELAEIPFFWTEQFDTYLYYVGHVANWDEIIWHGDLAERKFVAFFVKHGQVMAAAGCEYDHGMAYLADLMRSGKMPAADQIRSGSAELFGHLKK